MIRSMTGFGAFRLKTKDGRASVEIKTVNHKYLEMSCKLPNGLATFEDKIKALIQSRVRRGKIYYNVSYECTMPKTDNVHINKRLAEEYARKLSYLKKHFGLKGDIRLQDFVTLPGIFDYKTDERNFTKLWPMLHEATRQALIRLVSEREKEGKSLQRDLVKRIKKIKKWVVRIKARTKISSKGYKRKLEQKIKEIAGKNFVNNERLEMEVALFAKNSDISEELTRLDSHAVNFKKTINRGGETGKKLDFIAQELHREINTVGAKSSDYVISKAVIDTKSEIEKIREQLKNIE